MTTDATTSSENMIVTPGGMRPRYLVHQLPPGHVLRHAQQQVLAVDPNGNSLLALSLTKLDAAIDVESGWVCYAAWTNDSGRPLTSFSTTWTVPDEPMKPADQTLFLFNGVQNRSDPYGILQPVLQWGISGAGGGQYWTAASWYFLSTGHAFYSSLVRVNPGDVLTGVMKQTGSSNSTFNYQSEFVGLAGTELPVENIAELVWLNETLEVYWVRECANYPKTPSTSMMDINVLTGGVAPTMNWTPNNRLTECGEHITVVKDGATCAQIDIFYR